MTTINRLTTKNRSLKKERTDEHRRSPITIFMTFLKGVEVEAREVRAHVRCVLAEEEGPRDERGWRQGRGTTTIKVQVSIQETNHGSTALSPHGYFRVTIASNIV
jgi:hypothetical protein